VSLLLEAMEGRVQLEGPEEVVALLEVGAASLDLVDHVFHRDDSVFAEHALNDGVVGKGDSSSVHLAVASLVDQLLDHGRGGVSVGDEWLHHADHVDGGLVQTDEHSVVQLSQTQKLHNLLGLGGQFVDTSGTDHERDLCVSLNEEVASGLGGSLVGNELVINLSSLLGILNSVGSNDLALSNSVSMGVVTSLGAFSFEVRVSSSLLTNALGNCSLSFRPKQETRALSLCHVRQLS